MCHVVIPISLSSPYRLFNLRTQSEHFSANRTKPNPTKLKIKNNFHF
ncbi:hypothetical protein D083_2036 [Dickeya solani RNS 08.23.3.1.A]|nr:hypothetical protein D083_2036 [Dickeya solani RNS 08.23.3.1.A]